MQCSGNALASARHCFLWCLWIFAENLKEFDVADRSDRNVVTGRPRCADRETRSAIASLPREGRVMRTNTALFVDSPDADCRSERCRLAGFPIAAADQVYGRRPAELRS